jgi:membrane protein
MSRSETSSNRSETLGKSPTSGAQSVAPSSDDAAWPDSPADMTKPSWRYVARKTVREFSKDQCTDLAAALTYYSVLAVFSRGDRPVGDGVFPRAGCPDGGHAHGHPFRGRRIQRRGDHPSHPAAAQPDPRRRTCSVAGLLGALWSASGYVGAFGRAMNRMYEIGEGRPMRKLRPTQLLITAVLLVLVAMGMLALVVSGPLIQAIGDALGLGSVAITVWSIAKWPLLVVVAILTVAILYYATPNVRAPGFRWLSIGALVALVLWALLSEAFGFYVSYFSSYDKTYGSLAGAIVFLLWLWLTNLSLLFGAELDAELERGRAFRESRGRTDEADGRDDGDPDAPANAEPSRTRDEEGPMLSNGFGPAARGRGSSVTSRRPARTPQPPRESSPLASSRS